ncbi:acyl-CoA desaturase [Cyanobium gracile UHCC 0139]|uniref:Acyl-CoA desaturase n=1 Tax=Cyanobium gracile UHCC 0139 TaxID=3110308 RepID=A0ABU5RQ08_9CYAN|nr:acyl-CoA desaturase [Cyanobium gracile]MEA5389842.1 acyl-CoA desaturase [Cyanobium gracile UHCC 0139]
MNRITFGAGEGFHSLLRARVQDYFEATGQERRDVPAMVTKSAVILTWFALTYWLLVFRVDNAPGAIALSAVLGLAIAAIGFNIQHDGGHGAYSRHRWINRAAAMTLDLLGGSSLIWAHKHNGLHHTFTNIAGHDDDINLGLIGRLSPHQPHRWWHRWQHLYLWPLYGMLPIKWQFFDDFADLAGRGRGDRSLPRLGPADWVVFLAGKAIFFSLAFVVPLQFHPAGAVIACYVVTAMVQGIVLSVVFQLAHCVEEADFPMADPASRAMGPWADHQLATTVDFSRSNGLLSWLLGGLNYQVEHHLFPQICHIHYPQISAIVEQTCRDCQVPFRTHPSFLAGVASHYRWLRRMGQPPSVAALPLLLPVMGKTTELPQPGDVTLARR